MIGYIEGEVLEVQENSILLKTQMGIGYLVNYKGFAKLGESMALYTAYIVREQSQDLFGFKSSSEKEVFSLLLGVNGVGPKSAFSLICSLGAEGVKKAILFEDKKSLTKAPGIGPKAAAQILLNLKDKIPDMAKEEPSPQSSAIGSFSNVQEALMACLELGFNQEHILPRISKWASENPEVKAEDLIKKVLQDRGR